MTECLLTRSGVRMQVYLTAPLLFSCGRIRAAGALEEISAHTSWTLMERWEESFLFIVEITADVSIWFLCALHCPTSAHSWFFLQFYGCTLCRNSSTGQNRRVTCTTGSWLRIRTGETVKVLSEGISNPCPFLLWFPLFPCSGCLVPQVKICICSFKAASAQYNSCY